MMLRSLLPLLFLLGSASGSAQVGSISSAATIISSGLWFEDLVAAQLAIVRDKYPNATNPPFSLLEACGGVGKVPSGDMDAGACAPGPMASAADVAYVRLVFTPFNQTCPTVLALHNRTDGTTTYVAKDEPWIGDNEAMMVWPRSVSLEAAHTIFAAATTKGTFDAFVWRAMVYPCVTEPVFVFDQGPDDPAVFVGSLAKKACRTSVMTVGHTAFESQSRPKSTGGGAMYSAK